MSFTLRYNLSIWNAPAGDAAIFPYHQQSLCHHKIHRFQIMTRPCLHLQP